MAMTESPNIYYNPEKVGFIVVGELEYSSGSYEFDTRVVWYSPEQQKLYTARDSGCSCPTPFESIGVEDLTDITDNYSWVLAEEWRESAKGDASYVNLEDLRELIDRCRNTINKGLTTRKVPQ